MKRLIKRADAIKLQHIAKLDPELAIAKIKEKVPNFKSIKVIDSGAVSTAGMLSTDLKYIVEQYVYVVPDKNGYDDRWMAAIVAPLEMVQNGTVTTSNLQINFNHADSIGLASFKNLVNMSNFKDDKGEYLEFSENSLQKYEELKNKPAENQPTETQTVEPQLIEI